jgi:capsular exopolysaccharide synthesis family protein
LPGGGGGATVDPIRLLRQYKLAFFVAFVVGVAGGVAAYYAFARFAPQYKATVSYQALPPQGSLMENAEQRVDPVQMDRYAQTQVRIMVSDRVLLSAVRDPRLREQGLTWANNFVPPGGQQVDPAAAVRELKEMVNGRVITGTSLMELAVSAPTPQDAQGIVNAVHRAYWEDVRQQNSNTSLKTIDVLTKQVREFDAQIRAIDEQRRKLQTDKLMNSAEVGTANEDKELNLVLPDILSVTASIQRLQAEVDRLIQQTRSETGIVYSADLLDEAERESLMVNMKAEITNLRANRAAKLQAGLGARNQEILQIDALIAAKQDELNIAREGVLRKLFDARLERNQNALESLKTQLAELETRRDRALVRKQDLTQAFGDLAALADRRAKVVESLATAQKALDNIRAIDELNTDTRRGQMRLIEEAKRPDQMAFPRWSVMLAASVIICVGLTGGVIVLREVLDQRIKGPSDITIMPRTRLLGLIPILADDPGKPVASETAFRDCPSGAVAESHRQLRSVIVKRMQQAGHKTLLCVGAMPGSGTTSFAANFALACAAADQKVLVIDANFRRPAMHRVFKLGESPGLGEVLVRRATLDEAVQQTSTTGLHLLSAGAAATRTVPERLATEAMTQVIRDAAARYDIVVVDTAPAMVAGDGLALANRCDAVALVVRALAEKRGLVARIRDQFADARAESLGIIVNAVKGTAGGYMRRNIKASFEYHNNTPAA